MLINRIFNCKDSNNPMEDWTIETAVLSSIIDMQSSPPPRKDLRADWWSISDQQETGSCVGWAVADSLLRWHFVSKRRLGKNELLSARFVWMASKETDELNTRPTSFVEKSGTSIKAALDVVRDYGIVKDSVLPFNVNANIRLDENVFYSFATEFRIRSYFNLHDDNRIEIWKHWINQCGPVLIRLNVDDEFLNAEANGGHLKNYSSISLQSHVMCLVGYTEDHFIIRNSYGSEWGDNGYCHATFEYSFSAITESFGVQI